MSDGAAAGVVMSAERAHEFGLSRWRDCLFATAGCKPEEMGLGPVFAIPKALKLAGLKALRYRLIELNEAFAVQSLAVIQEAGSIPQGNLNGGGVALGIPRVYRGKADGHVSAR